LPVPVDRIPTVYPVQEPGKAKPKGGALRRFLARMRGRMSRYEFAPGGCAWMWRDGEINPATGLAMYGGVDSAGNPYGMGSIHHDWRATQPPEISSLPSIVIEHDSAWAD